MLCSGSAWLAVSINSPLTCIVNSESVPVAENMVNVSLATLPELLSVAWRAVQNASTSIDTTDTTDTTGTTGTGRASRRSAYMAWQARQRRKLRGSEAGVGAPSCFFKGLFVVMAGTGGGGEGGEAPGTASSEPTETAPGGAKRRGEGQDVEDDSHFMRLRGVMWSPGCNIGGWCVCQ